MRAVVFHMADVEEIDASCVYSCLRPLIMADESADVLELQQSFLKSARRIRHARIT